MGMTYDAARAQVVLFGGKGSARNRSDTWAWDGTDWTQRTPAHGPSKRADSGMTYDAARGEVVLFGGYDGGLYLGDTWTWDGTDWAIPFPASITLVPSSGPPGTVVQVTGWGFGAAEDVKITFIDSTMGTTALAKVRTDSTGAFGDEVTIPFSATPGKQKVKAKGTGSGQTAKHTFTVT
jgi:hypothetical protein